MYTRKRRQKEGNEDEEPICVGTQVEGELKVYTRKRRQKDGNVNTSSAPHVPSSSMSRPASTSEIPTELPNPEITGDMISSPSPIEIRRTSRSNAGVPPDRYAFPHDIAQFISYSNI